MNTLEPATPTMIDSARPIVGRPLRVGAWRVDPGLNQISRNGSTRHLEPRAVDLLLALAKQPGEVVSKSELLDRVWGGAHVTEGVLKRAVWELRRALGDDAQKPRWIQTIPRRGYRLIAPVIKDDGADEQSAIAEREGPRRTKGMPRLAAPVPLGTVLGLTVLGLAVIGLAIAGLAAGRRTVPPQAALSPARPVPLTALQGREKEPALSPDGTRLAFAWNGGGHTSDLYVKVVGAEHRLRLTRHPGDDEQPAFSPDGNRIAFVRRSEDPRESGIFVVSSLGGPARRLLAVPSGRVLGISWSPLGGELAVALKTTGENPSSVHLLSLESLELQPLTRPPRGTFGDTHPTFSPDGTLAFIRALAPHNQDIYRVAVTGGEPRRLTSDHALILGLAWLDDGKSVVYSSDRMGPRALWKVSAGGGAPEWLSAAAEGGIRPASDLRGHRLVFEQAQCDSDVWRFAALHSIGETPAEGVVRSTRRDQFPQLSPGGSRLAFVSNRTGDYEIFAADADGSSPVQLTNLRGPHVSALRWSPDGRSIAFEAWRDGQSDVFVVDALGDGVIRRVTDSPDAEVAPGWSADGQWIYFGSRTSEPPGSRTSRWRISRVAVGGGIPQQVTGRGGYAATESADGRYLFYSKHDEPGLWRRPLDGEPEELVVATLDAANRLDWVLTEAGVYFLDASPAGTGVTFFDFASGETSLRVPLESLPAYPGMGITPGGRSALVTRITRFESDVLMLDHPS